MTAVPKKLSQGGTIPYDQSAASPPDLETHVCMCGSPQIVWALLKYWELFLRDVATTGIHVFFYEKWPPREPFPRELATMGIHVFFSYVGAGYNGKIPAGVSHHGKSSGGKYVASTGTQVGVMKPHTKHGPFWSP